MITVKKNKFVTKTRQLWVRPWVVDTLWHLRLDPYFIRDMQNMSMKLPYELRLILVLSQFVFFNYTKKNTIIPRPLFNSQNKPSPDAQRRKRCRREIRHIYVCVWILYAPHAPKSCKEPHGNARTAVVSTGNNNNTTCKYKTKCVCGGL